MSNLYNNSASSLYELHNFMSSLYGRTLSFPFLISRPVDNELDMASRNRASNDIIYLMAGRWVIQRRFGKSELHSPRKITR